MMPIGVPRVPYRTPKEGSWQWVDIWNCLYRERIIFLSKPVGGGVPWPGGSGGSWGGATAELAELESMTGAAAGRLQVVLRLLPCCAALVAPARARHARSTLLPLLSRPAPRLLRQVDDELGNQLVATMLYLDSENKKDMNLYINCSGGEVRRRGWRRRSVHKGGHAGERTDATGGAACGRRWRGGELAALHRLLSAGCLPSLVHPKELAAWTVDLALRQGHAPE